MDDDQDVVIVDKDGNEHIFPAGFNPKRAAAIVRGGSASLPTKPVSAEDFAPKAPSWPATIGDALVGAAKGAAGLGKTALNTGLMLTGQGIGRFDPAIDPWLEPTTEAQRVGRNTEMAAEFAVPAFDVAKGAVSLAQAVPRVASKISPAAVDIASHLPVVGKYVRAGQVLGKVLDMGKAAAQEMRPPTSAPASVRPVTSLDDELAALEAWGAPAPSPPVNPNVGGRLVPRQAPTVEQAVSDALTDMQTPTPPARITTPPPPDLPAGYTPRTTVPKPKAVKASLPAEPPVEPPTPPKRAYFLKSEAQIADEKAATAAARSAPSRTLNVSDLPASWQARVGQDIFPTTGAEGEAVMNAFRQELRDRGLSVGEAIAAVSRNKNLPVQLRSQLLRALSKTGRVD